MQTEMLHIIGCASGVGGANIHSGDGPLTLQNSKLLAEINQKQKLIVWDKMYKAIQQAGQRRDEAIAAVCSELAHEVMRVLQNDRKVCVVGGDHSCAIGTWSGVAEYMKDQGDLGLIWIDAHMDSHTPETSDSGNIHGMPLAALLGHGYPTLSNLISPQPKLKPENVCLIGVRSFEEGEAALLDRLNVKVYFMDEVKQRGFENVLEDAVALVSANTSRFGVSLDIDAVDPEAAPGVDVPEKDGIKTSALLAGWKKVISHPDLIATEIVEFDPLNDRQQKTEKLIVDLLEQLAKC